MNRQKKRICIVVAVIFIASAIISSTVYLTIPDQTTNPGEVEETRFVDINASTWNTWAADGSITMAYSIYFGIIYGGGITTFPYKVLVNETVLAQKLGVSTLYLSNMSSIIFRGSLSTSPSNFAYIFHRSTGWYAFPTGFPVLYFNQSLCEQSIIAVVDK